MNRWQDGQRSIHPVLTATTVKEHKYCMEVHDEVGRVLGTLYITETRASVLDNTRSSFACRIAENQEAHGV